MKITSIDNIQSAGDKQYKTLELWWHLLHKCNYRCTYCYAYDYITSDTPENYYDVWSSVIKRLKLKSIPEFTVDILGGEPTIHPHLKEILYELSNIDKLQCCTYYTNLSKPVEYYVELTKSLNDKILGGFSYHPTYDKGAYSDKIKQLFDKGLKFYVSVNLMYDERYWDQTSELIKILLKFNIDFELNLLQETKKYKGFRVGDNQNTSPDETNKHTNKVNKFLEKYGYKEWYEKKNFIAKTKYVTRTNNVHHLTDLEIRGNGLDKFYNKFNCPAWAWNISHEGRITNVCTGIDVDLLFKECGKKIVCPVKGGCTCGSLFRYPKERVT